MLDGLATLARQETSSPRTLGREASKTLEVLARAIQDSLPADPPPEPRGSSASVVEHSHEELHQCLSFLRQKVEGEDGLLKSAWVDALIRRLSYLSHKIEYPRSKRQALLVGISYSGDHNTWPALDGPHEDVDRFAQLLTDTYGYRLEDITVLKDDPDLPDLSHPTRVNMIRELKRLVSVAAPGDTFVFLYSGHSDQRLATDDLQEEDGQDETIITSDEQFILDNELNDILVPLPIGCSLLAVLDTNHSGTLLDLPHHHCNSVYVPWQSKGTRRAPTMQNKNVRRQAAYFANSTSPGQPFPSLAKITDLQEPGD
ncbi:caspase domain-containing protein, partial [Lactarius psammicola]